MKTEIKLSIERKQMKAILKVKKYCEFQEEIEVTKKQLERIMNGNYSFDLDVLMMMVDQYGD